MTTILDGQLDSVRPREVKERGRTTVSSRALERVVSAVTADTFGVTARAVHVNLTDRNGLLAIQIRTPIWVASIDRVKRDSAVVEASGGTLIQRTIDAQTTIRARVTELSGAQIAHVTVQLTGITTMEEGRVR
ncbi:MAG TPA: hypothetical protein VLZ78_09920 [Terrimesophilobacter sp.]|nr:hypothetical protein [Terrimesophilobacter sp.]